MKYWLFDGEDIAGPFTPPEIAARKDFAEDILVCPETDSEKEDAWKPARSFKDFSAESLFKAIQNSIDEFPEPQTVEPVQKEIPKPIKPIVKKATPKKPELVSIPVSHVDKEELFLFPVEEPKKESQQETEKAPVQEKPLQTPVQEVPAKAETAPQQSVKQEESLPEHQIPVLGVSTGQLPRLNNEPQTPSWHEEELPFEPVKEPELNDISAEPEQPKAQAETTPAMTGSNPTENKDENTPAMTKSVPEQKAGTEPTTAAHNETAHASAEATPLEASSEAEIEDLIPASQPAQPEEPVKPEEKNSLSEHKETLPEEKEPVPEEIPAEKQEEPKPENPPEKTTEKQIEIFSEKPAVSKEPEIEKDNFLAKNPDSDADIIQHFQKGTTHKQPEQNKFSYRKMWLAVAAVFFLCILGIGAIRWGIQKKEPAPSEDLSATVKTMPVPEPSLPVKPEVLPDTPKTQTNKTQPVSKPISIPVPPPPKQLDAPLQAKALQIVKEYKLSGNRGTIESYFNRIYANQLAQGYQAQWATETLHKSTYIVKYRLIKPRMEPIVYVFQVDASAGKLTGALNNITLDLVGKI